MSQDIWSAVDRYIGGHFLPEDPVLEATLASSAEAGLPAISVSAAQGKFLQIMVELLGARRVLELGTLGGYSSVWMARALPADGRLVTLEADAKHAAVARANFARAGLAGRIELREGKALETLPILQAEGQGPFDFIFIDADKPNIPAYFDWALKLSRPGTAIIVDNVVRKGKVTDAASSDANVQGVRAFNERAAREPRVSITTLQTVGAKGYDGFAFIRVKSA
jgi:predicted O-methyltransferase YrrM